MMEYSCFCQWGFHHTLSIFMQQYVGESPIIVSEYDGVEQYIYIYIYVYIYIYIQPIKWELPVSMV